jgi:hypothetical protein
MVIDICRPWMHALAVAVAVSWLECPSASGQTDDLLADLSRSASDVRLERQLAPGVLRVIPPGVTPDDTLAGPFDVITSEVDRRLDWQAAGFGDGPNFLPEAETISRLGQGVMLRHAARGVEFACKPLRTIVTAVPNQSQELEEQLVWYLVYRVRYPGRDLLPELDDKAVGMPVANPPARAAFDNFFFAPRFELVDLENPQNVYSPAVLPLAQSAIGAKERVGAALLDHVQIIRSLPVTEDESEGVWGVVMWTGVDPNTNFLKVRVSGLTNAFQFADDASRESPKYERKRLELFFWRPGDRESVREDRIWFGVPPFADAERTEYILSRFGLDRRLEYRWVYE